MSISSKSAPTLRDLVIKTIAKLEAKENTLKSKMGLQSPLSEWIDLRHEVYSILNDRSLNHDDFTKKLMLLAEREKQIKKQIEIYNKTQKNMVKTVEALCDVQIELEKLRSELWFMDRR